MQFIYIFIDIYYHNKCSIQIALITITVILMIVYYDKSSIHNEAQV